MTNNKLAYKILRYGDLSDINILNTFNYLLDQDNLSIGKLICYCSFNNLKYISHLITNNTYINLLINDIEKLDLNVFKKCIENGLDINYIDEHGNDFLYNFIYKKYIDKMCIYCECDRKDYDDSYILPLLDILFENGYNFNHLNKNENITSLEHLINLGLRNEWKNNFYNDGFIEFTAYLIECGARCNNKIMCKFISHMACWEDNNEYIVQILNTTDNNGNTLYNNINKNDWKDLFNKDDILKLMEKN